jgi:CRISPR system Cascade subunit CasE
MYLSRLVLDPRCQAVRRDLADCQSMHRTLLSVFPRAGRDDEGVRAAFGVLYRVEIARQDGVVILVQSREQPDWTNLPPGYLLRTGGANPAVKPLDNPYASLQTRRVLAFRLRANPTRKIDTRSGPDGARRNGRRVELRTEAAQMEWLRRKGEQGGFELVQVRVSNQVPDTRIAAPQKIRGLRSSSGRLTLASVQFDGRLCVQHLERFRRTLERGIGPGKAYGLGLLSIAPAGQ